MKFQLFSKIPFKVRDPIGLIECYCFQNDFFKKYDLLKNKTIEDANKIGARIDIERIRECTDILESAKNLPIFKYRLKKFLDLIEKNRNKLINDFSDDVVKELLGVQGIGLSKATKILHTMYPHIMPMLDNPLQKIYLKEINPKWAESGDAQIFIDYYSNLKHNWVNINNISKKIKRNGLRLTHVRIFDILWWSYLKAEALKREKKILWSSIKRTYGK